MSSDHNLFIGALLPFVPFQNVILLSIFSTNTASATNTANITKVGAYTRFDCDKGAACLNNIFEIQILLFTEVTS